MSIDKITKITKVNSKIFSYYFLFVKFLTISPVRFFSSFAQNLKNNKTKFCIKLLLDRIVGCTTCTKASKNSSKICAIILLTGNSARGNSVRAGYAS